MKINCVEYRRNVIFIVSILAVILLVNYFYLGGYSLGISRIPLFNLNSGVYGGMLSILMIQAVVCFLFIEKIRPQKQKVNNRKKYILLTVIYFLLYALIYLVLLKIGIEMFSTLSRASILALFIGVMVVCAEFYGVKERIMAMYRTHQWVVVTSGVVAFLCTTLVAVWLYRIKELSANGRVLMWKMQINTILENPMGVGREFFQGAISKSQEEYFGTKERDWGEQLVTGAPEDGFNELLQIGVEQGVLGMLAFTAIFITALWMLRNKKDIVSIASKGGIITFLVFASFSYPLSTWQITIMVIVLLLMATPTFLGTLVKKMRAMVWIVAVALFGVYYLSPFVRNDEAYDRWKIEQMYFNMQVFEGTVDNYEELYSELKHEGIFLFEYGQCLAKTGQHTRSIEVLSEAISRCGDPMVYNILGKQYQANGNYKKAEECYWSAYYRVPHRFYPLYLLALLYAEQGRIDDCTKIHNKILNMPEKIPSTAIDDMKQQVQSVCDSLNTLY